MLKKNSVLLFTLYIIFFVSLLFSGCSRNKEEKERTQPSLVIPNSVSSVTSKSSSTSFSGEEVSFVSLIPLNDDETVIDVVSMDFNGDGFDDQVNAVKSMSSPYISVIVGLYNPKSASYERKAEIATEIFQSQSFSCVGIDMTGEHKISLVFQGFADNGDAILQAFMISSVNENFSLEPIADLRGDGSIFIQQVERYDAYERSRANGDSFPILVYTSDNENGEDVGQLQIQYDWSAKERKYIKTKETRVTGSVLEQKELSRIQGGTSSDFTEFLNGLWRMSDSSDGGSVFFDEASKEVIFFKDNTEEVYRWVHSNLRRNGIYLSTVNQEIENLQRRIDITLKGTDTISIRIQDDVRMIISESSIWDGTYKKTNEKKIETKKAQGFFLNSQVFEKETPWKLQNGSSVSFWGGRYSVDGLDQEESGFYVFFEVDGLLYVQFKPDIEEENMLISGFFSVSLDGESEEKYVFRPCIATGSGMIRQTNRRTFVLSMSS